MHTLSSKHRRAASRGLFDGRKTLIGIGIALGSKLVGVESGEVHSVMDAVKELWPVAVGILADLATLWARVRAVDFDKGVFKTKVFWFQMLSALSVAAGAFGVDLTALEGIVTRCLDSVPAVVALFGSVVAIIGRVKAKGPVRGIGAKAARVLLLGLLPLGLMSCASGSGGGGGEPAPVCPTAGRDVRQASCVAVKGPRPPLGVLFAWADGGNVWRPGEDEMVRLGVSFLDGSERQRKLAWDRFAVVDELAPGLELVRVEMGGDIRVAFGCSGHWSMLGRQARFVAANEATMNIELGPRDSAVEWDRVALHEMLHAIGLEHEHQHPAHAIPWDAEAVYAFYEQTQGWDRAEVDFQVLKRGAPKQLRTSGFDEGSIMLYPIRRELTRGRMEVGWNTRISPGDEALVAALYPGPVL